MTQKKSRLKVREKRKWDCGESVQRNFPKIVGYTLCSRPYPNCCVGVATVTRCCSPSIHSVSEDELLQKQG